MSPNSISQLLLLVASKRTGSREGWVLGHCPMLWSHGGNDANPSFGVSTDPKKKSRCKCLSCGYSGDLTDLLFDLQFGLKRNPSYAGRFNLALAATMVANEFEEMELTLADIPEYEEPVKKAETLFPEQWLSTFPAVAAYPEALAYCKSRGILRSTCLELDIRYDPDQQRIGFPFRNYKGELMGMQGRYIGAGPVKDKEHPDAPLRYFQYGYYGKRNGHVWMGEHTSNLDETIVLCEGPVDFTAIYQVYPNVAASFTSGLSRTKVRRIADADSIVTFYDHGNGGDAARAAITQHLPGYPIVHITPTAEEGDAGAMSSERIRFYLQEAQLDV